MSSPHEHTLSSQHTVEDLLDCCEESERPTRLLGTLYMYPLHLQVDAIAVRRIRGPEKLKAAHPDDQEMLEKMEALDPEGWPFQPVTYKRRLYVIAMYPHQE